MNSPLKGKRVLITAGPTREYWDPVRFLTNGSSGRTGIELAREAVRLGARVTLVLGPTEQRPVLRALKIHPVISAWDMYEAVKKNLSKTDYFIGAAAVVDYRPARPKERKIKHHHPSMTLRLYGNPDIIAMVGHLQKNRPLMVVGFALETDHLLEHAREKLVRKNMDWIVANRETNMGKPDGAVTLMSRWETQVSLKKTPKAKLAKQIWQTILKN